MSRREAASRGGGVARRGRGAGVAVVGYSRTRRLDVPEDAPGPLPSPVPESALYPVVARELGAQGFTCWRDVSFLGVWIDLYGRDADGESIAIELKVTDWKRALRQAVRIRNAADQVYVGLWAPYVHRAMTADARDAFAAVGIGLLSINGATEVRLTAARRPPRYPESVLLPVRPTHRPR